MPTIPSFEDANLRRWVLAVYLALAVVLVLAIIILAIVGVEVDLTNALLIWNGIGALLITIKSPTTEATQVEQMDVAADNVELGGAK